MQSLTVLVSAICFALLQCSVNADSFFWFLPNAPITRYQTTMVVPPYAGGGLHAVWPGLENQSAGFVFQSVVSDSNGNGWTFFVEYCCNPNYIYTPIKVYPGDTITSTFTLSNGLWTDTWQLVPGSEGQANGQQPQVGSSSNEFPNAGALIRGILGVELKNGGTWDFGQVHWSSISVTAQTTSSWCPRGYSSTALNYQVTGGTMATVGDSTTCTYPTLLFIGPQ